MQTRKKTSKSSAKSRKTSKKTARKKGPSRKSSLGATRRGLQNSRRLVDDVLVKVSPQVQKRVDQLIGTLNDTKEARMGDLKWLAGQILLRSREISQQLKMVKPAAGASRKKKK